MNQDLMGMSWRCWHSERKDWFDKGGMDDCGMGGRGAGCLNESPDERPSGRTPQLQARAANGLASIH